MFTYFSGAPISQACRVVHKVVDGVQRERLVHLNGAPREIVRHGEKVTCMVHAWRRPHRDGSQSIPAGPFARAFVREFDRINDTYMVDESGEGRVAGSRQARRIAVNPKDQHRYGYRLWLDKETSLLLRSELVDARRQQARDISCSMKIRLGDDVAPEALGAAAGTKVRWSAI